MAPLSRRGWSAIETEVTRRMGGTLNGTFAGRVQYWIAAGFINLCTVLHHFELDVLNQALTLSTSSNKLDLPSDCHLIVGMIIRNPSTNAIVGPVSEYDYRALAAEYRETSGVPARRARWGDTAYFDVKPDLAYKVDLSYYKLPAAPDFATGDFPVTGADCDEVLIEWALAHAYRGVGRPDLTETSEQRVQRWIERQPRPLLVQDPLVERRESSQTNTTVGGAQG